MELLEPWGVTGFANLQVGFGKEQTLRNLPPARVRLNASGLGATCYQMDRPIVDLSADAGGPIAIELASAGSIHGMLRPGVRMPPISLSCCWSLTLRPPRRLASPRQIRQQFTFEGLPPGRYRAAAQPVSAASKRDG